MAMRKVKPAANPDAYVAGLSGWRRKLVEELRAAVTGAGKLEAAIKLNKSLGDPRDAARPGNGKGRRAVSTV